MDPLEQKIKKIFIKNGLLLGAILLGLSIISFYFITAITTSPILFVAAPLFFSVVIPIIVVVMICLNGRKKIGGHWSFKQAVTGIFIMFLIAYIIQTVGRDLIFARLIEPNMIEKTETAFINASSAIKEKAGFNQKQMDQNIADIKKNFEEQKKVTIGKTIQAIAISIIFVFIFALIFAALFKRDAPLYDTQIDSR
ncbi:MAG TPA: DUF4199 domain-containing protein [Mucilaginibacter sp.]|jgi:hypothetical protein